MNHTDHVNLLRNAGITTGQTWADLGAGTGAFTLALAELLGKSGTIYAVDRDAVALQQQSSLIHTRYPTITHHSLVADFQQPLTLPPLDGILMANSLHFVAKQADTLRQLKGYLRDGGRFAIVEYNAEQGNQWVPYPLSYPRWQTLAAHCGFNETRQIGSHPSRFLVEIYAAVSE